MWSAEEMLDGQHQRVDIPVHARIAHNGLLHKTPERLSAEPSVCQSVQGLNWTELNWMHSVCAGTTYTVDWGLNVKNQSTNKACQFVLYTWQSCAESRHQARGGTSFTVRPLKIDYGWRSLPRLDVCLCKVHVSSCISIFCCCKHALKTANGTLTLVST